MKKLLCVREPGGHPGHLARLATLVPVLRAEGFDVSFAIGDLPRAAPAPGVPHRSQFLSGSIYGNLIIANPYATFEQVMAACRMAEIHEVIDSLPQGYKTEIGEHGVGLSGGQRQRLAIARALLKKPKILVLDEATSNLDADTAESFAETSNGLSGKVSVIFITHQMPKALRLDGRVDLVAGKDD